MSGATLPSYAISLDSLKKDVSETVKNVDIKDNALISYASKQLGMSEDKVTGGLASIFKVAQDNLTPENLSLLSDAIPNLDNYISQAPELSASAVSSLLGNNSAAIKAQSAQYLNSAFKKLGIPAESLPLMISTVSGYLNSNGYGEAAGMLNKTLSFL